MSTQVGDWLQWREYLHTQCQELTVTPCLLRALWTLSVAYFSRQKSKQRVGDPFLTRKEATGTSFSCSSGSPAFRERDLPWSRTNCDPLHAAGTTTLEWGLGGQYGSRPSFPAEATENLFTWQLPCFLTGLYWRSVIQWRTIWLTEKNDLWSRFQQTRSVCQDDLTIWMYILLMMSLGTTTGKSPGKCPVESDWGLTSGGGIDFSGITWYRDTDYQKLLGNKDYLHFFMFPQDRIKSLLETENWVHGD